MIRSIVLLYTLSLFATNPVSADQITAGHAANAARYSRAHGGLLLYVRQHGRVVCEDYYPGFSASTPHKIYSGTKSFVAVAALIAVQDGLLTLDEKASDTLTEWQKDRRRAVTINQLLSQTSGLDPDGEDIYRSHDQFTAALNVRLIDPPGTRFHYGAAGYQAFGELLKRKLQARNESVEDYLRDKLIDPLDINMYDWKHDDAGNPLLHAGMLLSAKEWAKFGEFICRGGFYDGKQFVNAQLFPLLFTGHRANPAYGLGFWLNRPQSNPRVQKIVDLQPAIDGEQIYPGGPADIYTSLGSYKQRLYMIPSMDIVIVRFGYEAPFSDGDFLSRLLTGQPHPDAHTH